MPEPSTTAAVAITSVGLTVFGVAIGLHPALLLAGFWGALWGLIDAPPAPLAKRMAITCVSAIVAAYATPAVVAVARALPIFPDTLTGEVMQFPCALLISFLVHRVIGPGLLRAAQKKSDEIGQ